MAIRMAPVLAYGLGAGIALGVGEAQAVQAVFVCDGIGDGRFIVTIQSPNTDYAEAIYVLGADFGGTGTVSGLQAAPTGSGFRYFGDGIEVYGKGSDVRLATGGDEIACDVFRKEASAPATPQGGFPVRAISLGGNVRSGPGMQFTDIGSIAEGSEIRLLENTGVVMNGYPWFRIEEMNGDTGFQWGGIICGPFQPVVGVFENCGS